MGRYNKQTRETNDIWVDITNRQEKLMTYG